MCFNRRSWLLRHFLDSNVDFNPNLAVDLGYLGDLNSWIFLRMVRGLLLLWQQMGPGCVMIPGRKKWRKWGVPIPVKINRATLRGGLQGGGGLGSAAAPQKEGVLRGDLSPASPQLQPHKLSIWSSTFCPVRTGERHNEFEPGSGVQINVISLTGWG